MRAQTTNGRVKFALLCLLALGTIGAGPSSASAAQQVVTSSGPLTNIYLNDNLACQVTYAGDQAPEFYGGTDTGACGTFLALPGAGGATVYGPNVPAGLDRTPYTPVSQTPVSGSGTSTDPKKVTTVVDVGTSGLRITQIDSYIVGQPFYRTDITVANTSASSQAAVLYHAGDCFLQEDDQGYGFHDSSSGGTYCSKNANNSPQGRIEGFVPFSSGSHYIEGGYSDVWAAINGSDFADTCDCTVSQDNGAGLSWALSVPANGSVTKSLATSFSPTGVVPDTEPPDTTIDSGPTGTTADDTPTFGFSSSETGSSFQCRVDSGGFTSCSSPHTTAALSDGAHTFQVRATDAAGNTDPTPASRSFTVATPPETTITSGPSGPTNDTTPTYAFSSSESGSTFECKVDGGAFASCSSPFTTATLGEGPHTISVRATDPAGNIDPTPATRSITVDTTAPQTTVDSGPTGTTNDNTPSFGFSSSEAASSFECKVDGGPFALCSSPLTTAALSDGSHTVQVRATDSAGNADPTPDSRTFTVDATAPQTTIDSGPSGLTGDSTPTFGLSSSEAGSSLECKIDGGAYAPCSSPFTTATLADGAHTLSVRATDGAGNVDATPGTRTFTVDTTPPETTITGGPTGATSDSTPTFSFTSSQAGSTFECKVDDGAFAPCTSPHTTGVLGNGAHTVSVRATDPVGNVDPTPASRTFTVDTSDTTPPQTTITSGPGATTDDKTPTFGFSSSESGSTFECKVDGGGFVPCASPHTTAALGDGPHTFSVRATDALGNVDATPATRPFTVDTTTTPAPPPPSPAPSCDGQPATKVGTAGNDDITGTPGNDVIVAGAGNDVIDGKGGKDRICAGSGDDRVSGGSGDDRLLGEAGQDRLSGGSGKDRLSGGDADDRLAGGSGNDRLSGGGSNDRLAGDSGKDRLSGGLGKDRLSGGAGKDRLSGGSGKDRLFGGSSSDRLSGGAGNDFIHGGPGHDFCNGGPGQDTEISCED